MSACSDGLGSLSPLFDWRTVVASRDGPEASTTRHVLLTLSLWMSPKGDSCFPTTRTLAEASGLTRRTVERHLRLAEEEGWIVRQAHGYGGQKWKRYEYAARIPRTVLRAVRDSKRGGEPRAERKEAFPEGGESDNGKVGNEIPISASVVGDTSLDTTSKSPTPTLDLDLPDVPRNGNGNGNGKKPDPIAPRAKEVFEYWRRKRAEALGKTGGPPCVFSSKRKSKVEARLREGYAVSHLKRAIDGCLSNPRNVRGGYVDLELICRSPGKVDQYLAWSENGAPEDPEYEPSGVESWLGPLGEEDGWGN